MTMKSLKSSLRDGQVLEYVSLVGFLVAAAFCVLPYGERSAASVRCPPTRLLNGLRTGERHPHMR